MQTKGRYTILEEIASGGTATVYLAEDTVLRRKVALKKLHPHLHSHPLTVRRFEKEAVAVASLSHGNIIKVYDYGSEEKTLFLAMEYVDGVSLDGLLQSIPNGMPSLTALSVFHQLLEGLNAAHANGIYHRDIKPSNILVDRKGCVRIADFGIAFLSKETSITKTGSYLGTPGYSAPEQAQGLAVTGKTDIFATGSLFYRSLTGTLPFEAETPHAVLIAIMEKTPVKACLVNRRILPGMAELIQDMMAKEPAMRPSASDCLQRLERIAVDAGFKMDQARICRLLQDSTRSIAAENNEISIRFAEQARVANKTGKTRVAMKLFSIAEIFSEETSEIRREAGECQRMRSTAMRKRAMVLASSICLCALITGVVAERRMRSHEHVPTIPFYGVEQSEPPPSKPDFLQAAILAAGKYAGPGSLEDYAIQASPTGTIPSAPTIRRNPKKKPATLTLEPSSPIIESSMAVAAFSVPPAAEGTTTGSTGFVWIKTSPPFAKIIVDGQEKGSTPIQEPISISSGTHELILEREGCEATHAEFKIAESETTSLRFTLSRVDSDP